MFPAPPPPRLYPRPHVSSRYPHRACQTSPTACAPERYLLAPTGVVTNFGLIPPSTLVYANYLACSMVVISSSGVVVTLLSLDMEGSGGNDYLVIAASTVSGNNAGTLASIYGSTVYDSYTVVPSPVTTTTPYSLLAFSSDFSNSNLYTGFNGAGGAAVCCCRG